MQTAAKLQVDIYAMQRVSMLLFSSFFAFAK